MSVKEKMEKPTRPKAGRLMGAQGETEAVEYLRSAGYAIVERNFRSRRGEIDIIAEKDGTLAFLEVKSWGAYSESELEYSIDARKQRRITETARVFLMVKPLYSGKKLRFDVIFISSGDSRKRVRHIENAFSGAMG
jgi:putative endonuclease